MEAYTVPLKKLTFVVTLAGLPLDGQVFGGLAPRHALQEGRISRPQLSSSNVSSFLSLCPLCLLCPTPFFMSSGNDGWNRRAKSMGRRAESRGGNDGPKTIGQLQQLDSQRVARPCKSRTRSLLTVMASLTAWPPAPTGIPNTSTKIHSDYERFDLMINLVVANALE